MSVTLTPYERGMTDGRQGRLKQIAIGNVVRYAEVLGATALCEVTKATVFCGNHNYLAVCKSDDVDEVFARMNLAVDESVKFDATEHSCQSQTCVAPCDLREFAPFGQSETFFDKNNEYLERAREAGVTIAGTCAPYLNGWLPIRGEHFVTTESGMTITGNSLWGACCNSDGIEAAFWSAICGRTPLWGMHVQANRAGNVLVDVDAEIESMIEWDLLGCAIGRKLPSNSIPVVRGKLRRANFNKLRQFLTSVAINSNCELCHIAGITPEAADSLRALEKNSEAQRITITRGDVIDAYRFISSASGSGPVDLVSFGCPHYDIDQIHTLVRALSGKKIKDGVELMVWTSYPIKAMADENGYTAAIERAGGKIYTSSCPGTIGETFLTHKRGLVFDSFKQCLSTRSHTNGSVWLADVERCVEAAVCGEWKEAFRWA